MRLTLRTLLAYMDGLLEPKDSQEIGKKIEDSKFATDLFHKIRDVMRRLRLGAPSITERAANLDCNTVAEYLDNAMPGDRVPDFEEVSLKSEMHLAEVASCHQILTMVLGEPVEIDPDSRQRMYQLPTVAKRVDDERLAAVDAATMLSADGNGTVSPVSQVKVRPRPVVPEYLRDPPRKSRLLPAAALMILLGAVIGLLLFALGQFNPGTPIGNALQWVQAKIYSKPVDDEDRDDALGRKPIRSSQDAAAAANTEAASKSSAAAASESTAPLLAKESGAPRPTDGKSEVPVPSAENPPAAVPGASPPAPAALGPALGTPGVPPASVAVTPPARETKPDASGKSPVPSVAGPDRAGHHVQGAEAEPLPGGAAVGTPLVKPPLDVARVDPNSTSKTEGTLPAVGPGSQHSATEDKTKIGRFMSDGQDVLLKLDANNAGWRRVLPEEFLVGRQPLLALPSYRPRVVVLNVGATLELVNGTRIELLPENAQGQPGVDIDFGRVVIKPLAQAGARLRVVVGSHAGTITLANVESIAGLEVTRVHDAGTDPEKVLSHALTKLYVARGAAVWEEGEGKPPLRLAAPAELMLDGAVADAPAGAGKDLPKWITANTVNELDQRAALSVSQALSADRAASLGLMELTEDRKREIRWLAARCLGYLGQFDPMTAALNDVDFHSEWHDYIDQLKEAIARGPETAAAIRQALEKQYGNDSGALYRMLWGYTDKELEDGEDARLVKFLDHESPVFRVLAFSNLKDITQKTLYYHPEATTAAKRNQYVQQWQRQLKLGQIRYTLPNEKPRGGPGEVPAKGATPVSPKPLPGDAPADVTPASGTEPIQPRPNLPRPTLHASPPEPEPGALPASPAERMHFGVPEPDPQEARPRVVVPEPLPASGQ